MIENIILPSISDSKLALLKYTKLVEYFGINSSCFMSDKILKKDLILRNCMYLFFIFRALNQTSITKLIVVALKIVTQPPCKNLNILAVKNDNSIVKKTIMNGTIKTVLTF